MRAALAGFIRLKVLIFFVASVRSLLLIGLSLGLSVLNKALLALRVIQLKRASAKVIIGCFIGRRIFISGAPAHWLKDGP